MGLEGSSVLRGVVVFVVVWEVGWVWSVWRDSLVCGFCLFVCVLGLVVVLGWSLLVVLWCIFFNWGVFVC